MFPGLGVVLEVLQSQVQVGFEALFATLGVKVVRSQKEIETGVGIGVVVLQKVV